MDGAEEPEVGSETSSTTRLAKNLPSNMAENIKVGSNGDNGDDEIVKRSPFSKKPNVFTEYSTFPQYKKTWVSLDNFCYG